MSKTLIWVLGIVVLIGIGFGTWWLAAGKSLKEGSLLNDIPSPDAEAASTTTTSASKIVHEFTEAGPALAGTYADADVVTLTGGSYRMYVATQPEVAGNNLEIYSAKSTDGITWTKEEGTRKKLATFPDVYTLPDGTFRMNFQSAGVIKSATSKDGLTFTDEAGTRIDATNDAGLTLDNVAAPTTLKLSDGSYLMVYRGGINEEYTAEKVPNKTMAVLLYATSTDGKTWTKKGLAVDTRTDDMLLGWADGPELVNFDGETRMYFSTYNGVFVSTYKDGTFTKPEFSWTLPNTNGGFGALATVPPGDPALLKVGNDWFMYFGRHPEGIYRATHNK